MMKMHIILNSFANFLKINFHSIICKSLAMSPQHYHNNALILIKPKALQQPHCIINWYNGNNTSTNSEIPLR